MRQLLFVFTFVLFTPLFLRAQVTFTVTDTVIWFTGSAQASSFSSGYSKFYNVSGDTLPMRWVRAQQNIPPWWRTSVCTEYYCFSIPDDSASWNLLPGDSDLVYVNLYPFGNSGTGDVVIRLFDVRQPAQFVDIRYIVDALASVPEQTAGNLPVFPNPAQEVITVQVPQGAAGRLRLADACGRTVFVQEVAAGTPQVTLATETLPPGCYLLQFTGADGLLLTTRFVRAN